MHSNLLNVRLLHMAAYIGTSLVLRQWMCGHAAVVVGYIFVWRLACWSDAGHGAQCRWCTCAAVGFCCGIIVIPRLVPVVFYICGVASLPANYLWWPPKGTIAGNSWSQLEACVKDNLQRLAQWYRTSDCTVHPQRPAESLAKAIQEALGGYKNLCKVLQRITENGRDVNPKDLERLKGIWNAVVKASPETTMKPRKESALEMPKKEDPRRITVTSAKKDR